MQHKPYTTDLTDAQWAAVSPLLPEPARRGRPRKVDLREVVNAILYQTQNAVLWRDLPRHFPPKSTVQDYYYRWLADGTWQRVLAAMRRRTRGRGRTGEKERTEVAAGA